MIPPEEIAILRAVVAEAYRLADAGRPLQGDLHLDLQLSVVELLPPRRWKAELIQLYRLALVGYRTAHPRPEGRRDGEIEGRRDGGTEGRRDGETER